MAFQTTETVSMIAFYGKQRTRAKHFLRVLVLICVIELNNALGRVFHSFHPIQAGAGGRGRSYFERL